VPVGVHSDREQGVHVDHPSAFADLEHERIGRDEGVGTLVEWAVVELGHGGVELGGHG
jgi:hypothetical protein